MNIPMIQPSVLEKLDTVAFPCSRHHVQYLYLFGSATTESFDPNASDLDFLVEFFERTPGEHADAFLV